MGVRQRETLHITKPRQYTYIYRYQVLKSIHGNLLQYISPCNNWGFTHLGGEFAGDDWGEIENMDTNLSMKLPS